MTYSPINVEAYTSAYSGAIAGMAISGWISSADANSYDRVTQIAGAFAQAFDVVWNNAATLNNLEVKAIVSVSQNEFMNRGPGPLESLTFTTVSNWARPAAACAALVLESDAYFAGQGITPGTPGFFANMLWVNSLAPAGGSGSVLAPFATPAEAVAAASIDKGTTIMVSPGDYSGTPAVVIDSRDINFICLGGPATGNKTPPARALMPNVTFAASAAELAFYATACVFPLLTVQSAVQASLTECTSTWADAGGLSVIRSVATPLGFGVAASQTFNGSVGSVVLFGHSITDLAAVNVVSTRGMVNAGGTGIVCSGALVMYQHEFGAGAIAQGTTGLFIDQWTLYQALELGADIGATPPLSVQELPALVYMWGAYNWTNGTWANPSIKFADGWPDSIREWQGAPRKLFAAHITFQVDVALAEAKTLTLYAGATRALAEATPTALAVTLPIGDTFAEFGLATPIVIPEGSVLLVKITSATPVVGNAMECHVTLL